MLKRVSIATVCAVLCTSTAFAQAVTGQVAGTVLVNKGTGFAPAGDGVPLAPGDVVMTKSRSTVVINYGNGCTIRVKPRRSVTIGSTRCDVAAAPAVVEGGIGIPGGAALGGVVLAAGGIAAGIILANDQKVPPVVGGGGGNGQPMSP